MSETLRHVIPCEGPTVIRDASRKLLVQRGVQPVVIATWESVVRYAVLLFHGFQPVSAPFVRQGDMVIGLDCWQGDDAESAIGERVERNDSEGACDQRVHEVELGEQERPSHNAGEAKVDEEENADDDGLEEIVDQIVGGEDDEDEEEEEEDDDGEERSEPLTLDGVPLRRIERRLRRLSGVPARSPVCGTAYKLGDARRVLQGLAVEALVSMDEYIEQLIHGDAVTALPWLTAANQSIIGAVVVASEPEDDWTYMADYVASWRQHAKAARQARHGIDRAPRTRRRAV